MARRELGIWRRLDHRNIVPFLGIAYGFGRQGSASLVSSWMPHGTLHTFLEEHDDRLAVAHRLQLVSRADQTDLQALSQADFLFQLLDIANGLRYRMFSFALHTPHTSHLLSPQCTHFPWSTGISRAYVCE